MHAYTHSPAHFTWTQEALAESAWWFQFDYCFSDAMQTKNFHCSTGYCEGNISTLLICKWNVVNVIFTMLWTETLLTKIIAHVPTIIVLGTGTIQRWSRIVWASTVHGRHVLDHTMIGLAMSTFQTWAQRGHRDVTRPYSFLTVEKGLVPWLWKDNERTCSYNYTSNKLGQDSQSDVVSYQESLVHMRYYYASRLGSAGFKWTEQTTPESATVLHAHQKDGRWIWEWICKL